MMSDSGTALLLNDVTKIFKAQKRYPGKFFSTPTEVLGLHNINLRVGLGEVMGLIGANGSGKTTLLKIMSGALQPTSGRVMAAFRPRLISLSGLRLPNLSVLENTELMLRAHGRGKDETRLEALELIHQAELSDKTYLPYNTLSTGMMARLGFFLTTINQPEILLMDEILSVADRRFQEKARAIISSTMTRAKGVVIASHSMNTIQENCKTAVVMHKGSVVFQGPAAEAVEHYIERFQKFEPAVGGPSIASANVPRRKSK